MISKTRPTYVIVMSWIVVKKSKSQKISVFEKSSLLKPLKVDDFVCKERFGVSSDKKKRANMYALMILWAEVYSWKTK